jgi:hypothetical protein
MPTVAEILIRSRDQYSKLTDQAKRDVIELGRVTKASMGQAKDSADILKDTLGIHLPRELTKIIAQSRLVGPALATAFSGVAIFGFIAALGQLPALFDKLKEKVTGWDEASQKAYANFLENNRKAVEDLTKFQAKLAEIQGGSRAGLQVQLADAQRRAEENQRLAVSRRNEFSALEQQVREKGVLFGGRSGKEIIAEAEAFQEAANKAAEEVRALNRQLQLLGAEETQKSIKDRAQEVEKASKTITDIIRRNQAELLEAVRTGNDALARASRDYIDTLEERGKHAEEQLKNLTYWEQQLSDFRNRTAGGGDDVRAGEQAADRAAQAIIRNAEELRKKNEEFFRDFRQGAGEAWDAFTSRGLSALSLLNAAGRTLFQNFATGLFTGARGSGGGLAGFAGNLGSSLGIGTGLAGLFSGGAGASIATIGSATLINPVTPALAAPAFGGGIGASLGFGGGAGLLGLGAATIPVIGGIAAGAFLLGKWLFGRKRPEAPFTQDPNAIEQSRSIFFFTTMAEAADKFSRAVDRFSAKPASYVVAEGLPGALNSSNQFRRNVAATMMDDDL